MVQQDDIFIDLLAPSEPCLLVKLSGFLFTEYTYIMKTLSGYLYGIVLSLWVGGMSLFTFVLTPVIFKSYPRDTAGEIVGTLFPSYFLFTLAVSAAGMVLFLLSFQRSSASRARISLVLVSLALVVSVYVNFRLYPETIKAKQEVHSFETAPDDPSRLRFRRLHAQSAVLNLIMIADGLALLVMQMRMRKLGPTEGV